MDSVDQDPRDIDAIKQLKARYFRYMDTKRWSELRRQFTDDAKFDGTNKSVPGPDEFVAWNTIRLGPAITVHQGHIPEIVLTSATTAKGIWAMFDWVEFPEPIAAGRGKGYRGFVGYGHYEEEYRKENGTWKIAFLRLTRLRVNPVPDAIPVALEGWLTSSRSDWLTERGA